MVEKWVLFVVNVDKVVVLIVKIYFEVVSEVVVFLFFCFDVVL